jgi:hypothetical protein
MALIVKPPAPLPADRRPSVFLAGSIEQGRAPDWQTLVAEGLSDLDVLILNPRRDDWDASWRQSIDDPRFREQVEWELAALERAACVVLYFAPATQAPVSLLELGLYARSGKLAVCCPDGYWRKGNVDVVCRRYGTAAAADLAGLIAWARRALQA